jgi:hypothetical protein
MFLVEHSCSRRISAPPKSKLAAFSVASSTIPIPPSTAES